MPGTAQWIIIAGIIAGFISLLIIQQRNRRWDLADRREIAAKEKQEREETAEKLAAKATAEAERVSGTMIAEARLVADRVVAEANRVAEMLVKEAAQVAAKAAADRAKLAKAIEVNTEISTKAFKEANTINHKIESLGLEHNALQREKREGQEVISEVVHDVQDRVVRIEEKVVDSDK